MNTKKNSHYQFTHELIQQTMARLLEKNELKDITVKKLCAVAGINRSTFYKNIILQTLNEAVKNGMLQANPCQFVELPKKQRYESSYYSADQLKTLFDAIRDDPIYPLVKITALYGLRRSEVLGLKWDSVDFTAGRRTVNGEVIENDHEAIIDPELFAQVQELRAISWQKQARRLATNKAKREAEHGKNSNGPAADDQP